MNDKDYKILVNKICKKTGFVLDKIIYKGNYYKKAEIRNTIFSGTYKNNPAILKIYNDKRLTDEPLSLNYFNKKNKSKILSAPKIYNYEITSCRAGWFIMEKLPEDGKFFKQPLSQKERKEFLNIYLEYKKHFPKKPHRNLDLAEKLNSAEFHLFRIHRWFELAVIRDEEEYLKYQRRILEPAEFIPIYRKAIKIIKKEFKNRKMVWCHGHFKPHEICKISNNEYYLIDFAHTKMYPEGYELGFIIWADWLMGADWKLDYREWKKGIQEWIAEMKIVNEKLKIERFDSLIRASLVERSLGTILADITAADRPFEEKERRIKLLYKLIDDLANKKI
ncbi:MAG: hypothetical protein KAQ87_00115 [Candidatus Pacebacteria bacterium]|nr:hypothetical protein [Candidatus Paceibacterota bacterium]